MIDARSGLEVFWARQSVPTMFDNRKPGRFDGPPRSRISAGSIRRYIVNSSGGSLARNLQQNRLAAI